MEAIEKHNLELTQLSASEARAVTGGLGPAIALAAAAIGHFTARGIVSGLAARVGLAYGVYDAAKDLCRTGSRPQRDGRATLTSDPGT